MTGVGWGGGGGATSPRVLLHLYVLRTFLQASVSSTRCRSSMITEAAGSSSSDLGPTVMLSNSYIKSSEFRQASFPLSQRYAPHPPAPKMCFYTGRFFSSRHTFISMSMSEGSEALWVQCGGQDAAVSRPAFLLGVVDCSRGTSPPAASSESAESGTTGLSMAFITRSYLLFHSRLIKADGEQKLSFR